MNPENRILIEVVDGWALGEECDLPLDRIERLMNAVRAKERARAIEVVKPFAKAWAKVPDVVRGDPFTTVSPAMPKTDMIRAAAYVSDSQSKEG